MTLRDLGARAFSGHVLLIDEPEAHLHPSAVASMVRWCHRMVQLGFTVVVASHHEEFLRSAGEDVTLVRVTRKPDSVRTSARTLPT
ncbi:AAA family ATPase [Rhodococcus hoagii]|nr:AAA family ATPase [Prescottella equi]